MTTKSALLKAVRAKCLDCSCHQPSEVAQCTCTGCTLWPFRFGRDPDPARTGNPKNLPSLGQVFDVHSKPEPKP